MFWKCRLADYAGNIRCCSGRLADDAGFVFELAFGRLRKYVFLRNIRLADYAGKPLF